MRSLGAPEILIIALVILLLFGAKKLPDLARSIGSSAHELRKGLNGDEKQAKQNSSESKSES